MQINKTWQTKKKPQYSIPSNKQDNNFLSQTIFHKHHNKCTQETTCSNTNKFTINSNQFFFGWKK